MSVNKVCLHCGIDFLAQRKEGKYCSEYCYHRSRVGKRSPNWKGGRKKTSSGYIEIYKPGHDNANVAGYVLEHVLVMSEYLGGPIGRGHVVHHINEDKMDNRIKNLKLMTRSQHMKMHQKGKQFSDEHRANISRAKKKIANRIERNSDGAFKGGVSYGQ